MYRRGVPSAHGRKGANQFTIIAPGHPSGVQARGAQRTWTEGGDLIQQQKPQGTPQVHKRGVPSAHGRKGEIDSSTKAPGHPSGVQARGAQRTWTEGSESVHNNSPRAPLRCTSEGCPAHLDGRERIDSTTKNPGHPSGVQASGAQRTWTEGSESGQKITAPGHPSGVQARGAQRTRTEGRNRFNNKSPRAPLRCTSEGCPAHMDGRERISSQS